MHTQKSDAAQRADVLVQLLANANPAKSNYNYAKDVQHFGEQFIEIVEQVKNNSGASS